MKLHQSCILVALSITLPPQTKTAKAASEDVEYKYGTARKQGRVTKKLFPEKDIKPLIQAMSAARARFNEITLPYDDAYRLVPTDNYWKFNEVIMGLDANFDQVKHEFLNNYEDIKNRAVMALGTLFSGDDYPSKHELANIISFKINSTPVPEITAFDGLIGMEADVIDRLKQEALDSQQERVEKCLGDLFKRLHDSLHKARVKLSVEDSIFRDTLIGNIKDALHAADTLNFAKNQNLIDLSNEIREVIEGITPQELRDDKDLRKETAEQTEEILKKMAGFF